MLFVLVITSFFFFGGGGEYCRIAWGLKRAPQALKPQLEHNESTQGLWRFRTRFGVLGFRV